MTDHWGWVCSGCSGKPKDRCVVSPILSGFISILVVCSELKSENTREMVTTVRIIVNYIIRWISVSQILERIFLPVPLR